MRNAIGAAIGLCTGLIALTLCGCRTKDGRLSSVEGKESGSSGVATGAQSSSSTSRPQLGAAPQDSRGQPMGPDPGRAADTASAQLPNACPAGMVLLPGGDFWIGSKKGTRAPEESPRFQARLAPFCLDETEVTTAAYDACVAQGSCSRPHGKLFTCNGGKADRQQDPINCIDYHQAVSLCQSRGARLPSEVEWEYAGRGGDGGQLYSWGNESPDGRVCWKTHKSCPVKSYPPGKFGLYDMQGNVWEWTSDGYGDYPWPEAFAVERMYRGGSWSRRFDKWLHPSLRNHWTAKEWGSHLGVRCALTPPSVQCPGGLPRNDIGGCPRVVLAADCPRGQQFNGVRCARPGDDRCPPGREERAGYGCARLQAPHIEKSPLDLAAVVRTPSPQFDEDCLTNYHGRPKAYRLDGGSHEARNAVGSRGGCKNRDVGVGFNSVCCP
jgi:formylglycine-generating enzyme required for sulfatase activity